MVERLLTGGASRQGARPCPVLSLPGRPALRNEAPKTTICFVASSLVAATYAIQYASLLGISDALHLVIFEQPLKKDG